MSSRQIRRAERELAERQEQERLEQGEASEEESEEEIVPTRVVKPNVFAMLGNDDDDNGDEDEEDDAEERANLEAESEAQHTAPAENKSKEPSSKSSKRNKKRKGKNKAKSKSTDPQKTSAPPKVISGLDEIDRALLALKITSTDQTATASEQDHPPLTEEKQQLYSVLSVDTQHLHAANEMKKLFGRAALNSDEQARARPRGHGSDNRNLASIGLRRNIFIQGKEEWPRATSGGLGMEVVERRADGSIEYRFVHNGMYQEAQRKFQVCVRSMDPERMIDLLRTNPYHISTLLQVSEIAKQQRDNATASDLLERTLFTFGRSVHSTFSVNLAAGKARLDFRRPENREFWLAVWRYIITLGVRATWRTSFEWAKLLIAMDPDQDPYCMRLLVDQLALRGRDPQALVDIIEADHLQRCWQIPPNLAFSLALAYDRLKEPQKARSTLRNAVKEYPWLAARLCKELDISPIPKSVWGTEPNNNYQELLCQLYVGKAKDLWNTTEGTTILVEICHSFSEELGAGEDPYWLAQIPEMDLARHVILSDDRSLLSLIDNRVKSQYTSVSDPLPPIDDLGSHSHDAAVQQALLAEYEELRQYFDRIDGRQLVGDGGEVTEARLRQVLEQMGSSMDEFTRTTQRLLAVRARLRENGVQVGFESGEGEGEGEGDGDGSEAESAND